MGRLFADVRYAMRTLINQPAFSAVAIAALALGIGANTAIFSVVNGVLLQPLPYPAPERLVRLVRQFPAGTGSSTSITKFMVWRRAQSFDAVAASDFAGPGLNVSGGDRPEQVRGIHVSAGYFAVYGVSASIGRTFTTDEDRPGGAQVAVLSHALWSTRFGGDAGVIGRTIVLNGEPYTAIGVLAAQFRSDPPADVFIPLQADPNSANQGNFLRTAARLKAGTSIEVARAEMTRLGDDFRRVNPRWMGQNETVGVVRMQEFAVRDVRPALLTLLAAVALVLLIACANVANLLLARSAARQKEIAVRAAIGATRGQIVRQVLTESVLLAGVGALVGSVLGVWGARALLALSPGDLPRAADLAGAPLMHSILDWRLLAFTAGVSVLTGVLFGLAPALHLARADLGPALKEGGERGSTGVSVGRTRGAFVMAEMALAVVLLVGALLLIRTFVGLRAVHGGFNPANVLTLQTSMGGAKYQTTTKVAALVRQVTTLVEAIPGVQASAVTIALPTTPGTDLPFKVEGRALAGDSQFHGDEQYRFVSPEYFRALSIPLQRGRGFTDRDVAGAPPVLIVNAAMATKYWPGGDVLGQQITIGRGLGPEFEDATRTIVGVVGDVRENGLDQPAPPAMYIPHAQLPDAMTHLANALIPMTWVIRATGNPAALAPSVQRALLAVDAHLPVANVRTMEQVVGESIARQNFNMVLLTIFGVIALLLAAIGIYGVMSYSVEQGAHEIGVRLALGAERRDILALIVGRGMRLAIIGVALGVAAAFGGARVLSKMLFGVGSTDPSTYVAVVATLGTIAFFACYLPALRATRLDPIIAMRQN
jgi:putative ABC transport system permease protein